MTAHAVAHRAAIARLQGYNVYGQLGDGTASSRSKPAQVSFNFKWAKMAAGASHTCGIVAGELSAWCWVSWFGGCACVWRAVFAGFLGPIQGRPFVYEQAQLAPTSTDNVETRVHTCLQGYNNYGQLGDGSIINRQIPTRLAGTESPQWASLTANEGHTCAIRTSGELFCWGYNVYGQLGDGTVTTRNAPSQVMASGTWTQVVISGYAACGLSV